VTRPYKKNRKKQRNTIKFPDLTEEKKDNIVEHILASDLPINLAADELNVGVSTVSKIFAERFTRKEKEKNYEENTQTKTN
tara:strand:- start:54 stop:296 length:243 start_codon:yes stop_codon:yes gene_type:complete